MLTTEELMDGNLIITDFNTLGRKSIAVIQNVKNAMEVGRRRKGQYHAEELVYDLFFPETGEIATGVCQYSGVTTNAISTTEEKAVLFLEQQISKNNEMILSLRARNILIRDGFEKIFKQVSFI